ncbi:MAG: HlyC/CorC family transporter [Candidatus Marinimicrobia bacterium]|jgi:gliding motility-associated protein GldE|nr:HlyC/CorC family transporter [Candidatus Neomarinimicrobiota bacterium]MBT3576138.1 HlyC/CorC family transporter [Candidatus Neomarinimicrobiota bacterium]MBT3678754.1 HlyC/CorC family transporter [Candidatus Neomarinimicrobiota bacterium]MBT3951740.1 HlyC/CorC family transporter [Candidatus Neomarinimicrobiota bacterium]MBT4251721.1 HlyC/CorC family transporter [Candidatus Neomarinimicrobiota bacterium]
MELSEFLESTLIWQVVGFVLLLGISAFFSGSETALFNLKRNDVEKLKHDLAPSSRLIVRLLATPKRLLITILTGNTIVNVALASMAALITAEIASQSGVNQVLALVIETIVLTIILVILGEITPKVLAMRHSLGFASRIIGTLSIIFKLFSPIAQVVYNLVEKMVNITGIQPEENFTSDEEIKELVELGQDQGVIGEEEKEMIHSIIEFGDTQAKEIMIPRPDVMMFHTEMSRDEVLTLIRESGYSKYPLYKDQIDQIRGIVFIKDILPYLHSSSHRINLERLARQAMFVPEHQPVDDLLREMQREKQKLAVVVDEYGGFSGMIAVEDIIEEVLGDLKDEIDDSEEETEIVELEKHVYMIEATTHLDDVAEVLGIEFVEDRDFDSIGGFIYSSLGTIPEPGEVIEYENFKFEVLSVEKNRIEKVKVTNVGNR